MTRFSSYFLLACTVATISVMWVDRKWATSLPELGCLLLAAAWVVLILLNQAAPRLSVVLPAFGAVIALGLLQLFLGTTVYSWPTRLILLYWCGNAAAFFCGLQTFSDRQTRNGFLRALVVFGFLLSIFSTIQAVTSAGKVYWYFPTRYMPVPVFGPFLYSNQFSAFLELLLPVAIYLAITAKARKAAYYFIAATLYASVIASASRSGFVLSTIELAAVPALVLRHRSLSRAQLVNGALATVGMLLWLAIPAGTNALISKLGTSEGIGVRAQFNESSLDMIKARPLVGFGLGNWPIAYPGYAKFDDGVFANQAHDDWAQWTVEGGIPLLLIMLFIAGWATVRGVRTGWGLGVPIVFLHCFVDYPIQRPGVAIVFFLLMAATAESNPGKSEATGS